MLLCVKLMRFVSISGQFCSQQHSPHFYFCVIFISVYPAAWIKIYAYANKLGKDDLITALELFAINRT